MSEHQYRACRPICNYRILCGNSTVVDQDNEPWASWGQMIPHFFGTDVCIANYAESGESANTFIGAKRLAKALSQIKKETISLWSSVTTTKSRKDRAKGLTTPS